MAIKFYIGSGPDITARLAGAPNATTTTVASVTDLSTFTVNSVTSFSAGDTIAVRKQRAVIASIDGTEITLQSALTTLPQVGDTMAHYNADYSAFRDVSMAPLTITKDIKTGGETGNSFEQSLVLMDVDYQMVIPINGLRATIFDDYAPDQPIFAGSISRIDDVTPAVDSNGELNNYFRITVKGYQAEADSLGIEEAPATNVNAGKYLQKLLEKYTLLEVGEIDTTNSPTIDYIRLGSYRRFSDVGRDIAGLWPGGQFYIDNGHTAGKVYFRAATRTNTDFSLSKAFIKEKGPQNVSITRNFDKVFNIVRFPFYKLQEREPDLFQQNVVVDNAFLKTSVVLNGQPANVEESILVYDDFTDGSLSEDFLEYDLTNASPPPGYTGADGYLIEGNLNDVNGLHLYPTTSYVAGVTFSDIGRVTDPAILEPFTGEERQQLYIQEMVISTLGEAAILGIVDQTTRETTVVSGATTTSIPVTDATYFAIGDRITVGASNTYITNKSGNTLTVNAITAPTAGTVVTLHDLAKSRIKFSLYFKANGDLKYIKNGTETAFSPTRTYTTATYSIRMFMEAYETTATSGNLTTAVLTDATNFTSGDVVELFTLGNYNQLPETRVVTKAGSTLTFDATINTIQAGYRVRTKPKLVVQIKGGAYGDITGRDWTTIHTEANTYQTTTATPDESGVLLVINKSLVGTIPVVQMKNPIGVTANVGGRFLHIGAQDIDSSEKDIDCILRKLGSHYQLDFFPDTKQFWPSGETLELRYKERFRHELIEGDLDSMREIALRRGLTIPDNVNETQLTKMGGRVLDTIQIEPSNLTVIEASSQIGELLQITTNAEVSVTINTNTFSDNVPEPGQMLPSEIDGINDIEIKQVQLTEIPGAVDENGRQFWALTINAGSIDRLGDLIQTRRIENSQRLVIDDGYSDDTYTLFKRASIGESVTVTDSFDVNGCTTPSIVVYNGSSYALLMCLKISTT